MKKCRTCGVEKSETNFYKTGRKNANPESRHTECKDCTKSRVKSKYDPQRSKSNDLLRKYGLTLEQFSEKFEKQNGLCEICGRPGDGRWRQLCVDHCHKTGKVRDLLCRNCNVILGQVNDDAEYLVKLINYLNKHKS